MADKRTAPTIDLTATEIKPAADSAGPPHEQVAEPPEATPEAAAEAPPPPAEEPEQAAAEAAPPPSGGGSRLRAAALTGGIVGGIVVAVAAGALWYMSILPGSAPQTTDASADIAALQKQVQDLRDRPAATPAPAPASDTKAIDALNARLAKLESTLANLPKGDASVSERLVAAENAMKSFALALSALGKHDDDVAAGAAQARAQADAAQKAVAELRVSVQNIEKSAGSAVAPAALDAVERRIATLEQSVKTASAQLSKVTTAETAVRRTLVATALRNAVTAGAPFEAELKEAKSFGAGNTTTAALTPFASKGVPSTAALAAELRSLMPLLMKAAGADAPQGSFLERLQANASKLVRVTPIAAPPGDDPSAVLARVEIAAAHNNIDGALADLAKLSDSARAPARGWIEKARARQAALAAADEFAAASARALSQPERPR